VTDWAGRRLHFIGIGGAGMSGLAIVARALGAEVTGTDARESPLLDRVRAAGATARAGHDAAHLPPGDDVEVVVSTAIPPGNPERAAARQRGLRELHRGELLAEVAGEKRCVAVAGAHGKTTTTSMIAHALLACGLDPAYLIGGDLRATGTNAAWGSGEWIVVEADESDRSFLHLRPDVGVVTNVELDHHTTYASRLELEAAFAEFVRQSGTALLPEGLALPGAGRGGATRRWDGWDGPPLAVPGEHNRRNAAAALAACVLAGANRTRAATAIAAFTGAGRRFERLGTTPQGAEVVDDYAHHPTEVAATLAAARTLAPKRLVAVFQPHLYSRTQQLARSFGEALGVADLVAVLGIYPARERADDFPGVSGLDLLKHVPPGPRALWLPTLDDAAAVLPPLLRDGDLVLCLGAGNVDELGRKLVAD